MTTRPQLRAVTERRMLDNTGLDPALTGTVSTGVLRWAAAAIVNAALGGWPATAWVTEVNSATLGTTLKVTRRGLYHVMFSVEAQPTFSGAFGISLDSGLLTSATNPINGTAGILVGQQVTTPAATQVGVTLPVAIPISDTLAGDAARGVIRVHGNNGAGGPVSDAFIETQARYRLTYIGDVMGT